MDMIEHRVRERAYFIWEDEGRVFGRADAHWVQAEKELAVASAVPASDMSVAPAPAKSPAPRAKAPAKVAAKVATAKAAATKVAAPKAATKAKKAARSADAGAIAFH